MFGSSPPRRKADSGTSQPAGKLESTSAMPVYKDRSHEELRWEDYQLGDKGGPSPAQSASGTTGFGASNSQSNPFASSLTFGQSSANPFLSTTPSNNPFAPKLSAFDSSGFGSSTTATFGSSAFGTSPTSIPFGSSSSATPSIYNASAPSFGSNSSPSLFGSSSYTTFASSPSLFGSAPASGTTSAFGSGSSFGNTQSSPLFQSTTPSTNPFVQTGSPFGQSAPAFGQSNLLSSTGFGGNSFQSTGNPMGFVQTTVSRRRMRLPARKYQPDNDGPKVPFFTDDQEPSSTPKADAFLIPRENPRSLVVRPLEQWHPRTNSERKSPLKDIPTPNFEIGKVSGVVPTYLNGSEAANKDKIPVENGKQVVSANSSHIHNEVEKWWECPCWRAGEAAALVFEHGAAIEALLPKLRHSYYYTQPRLQELALKERAEPGYCRHVKDFVVGRYNFGSIRFIGETDVRGLDIETLVQFNHREVIVYMDETKKPPVGQGLNKPAEVTLHRIKCFDKKTGLQYTEGPKIVKCMDMLKKKAEDQGAQFVSYDPIKGVWKFRVDHF